MIYYFFFLVLKFCLIKEEDFMVKRVIFFVLDDGFGSKIEMLIFEL